MLSVLRVLGRRRVVRVFWVFLLVCGDAFASPQPKLVVLIAVDQFRADYLTRFEDQFLPATREGGKPGGFRYLMEKGAYFPQAHTIHFPNVTAVGHAAMLTGALPYLHGIVSNYWYDRKDREKRYCVEDAESPIVGGKSGPHTGRSPRSLLVTTVGDELKNAFGGKPRVISLALKDRAAILMGGHRADLAFWYDDSAGWVTSAYYLRDSTSKSPAALPEWLAKWNRSRDSYLARSVPAEWTPLLPEKNYWKSLAMPDETVGEAHGLGKRFPHPIRGQLPAFLMSPFANGYSLETALTAVKAEKLGRGPTPDLLAVSLSAFDMLGHTYGPLSREMQDATLRLDRDLSAFLGALAHEIPGGLSNVIIALTADHGVQANPLYAAKVGMAGGAVLVPELIDAANARLRSRFGFSDSDKPVAFIFEDNIFFDHALFEKRSRSVDEAAHALAGWLREQPFTAAAYARDDLLEAAGARNEISRRMAASAHPSRSGDVLLALRPGFLSLDDFHDFGGTGHESPIAQDAAVPLLFAGAAFQPGRYQEDATLIDLAPTLAAALGISPPSGSEGHVLSVAFRGGPSGGTRGAAQSAAKSSD